MFDTLKHKFGLRALRKIPHARRHAKISNYHDANRVGVLYWAKSESDFILVKQFLKNLKSEYGIRHVKALAYIDSDQVPDYFLRSINQDWIMHKNVKWNKRPFGTSYESFLDEEYDILIDFTDGECLPLRFAQKESQARFKVGKSGAENEDLFDLLIQVREGDTFDKYLRKINHFLKVINEPHNVKEFATV